MKLRIITCLLTLMQAAICVAQTDFKKIAPPNPNVASLMKAALTPVTEYAGTANVGVPLYTISLDNVNLPISLDYHTGGIQVAEESGVVGLGWALNAGGVIIRNKMGMDDFANSSRAYLMPNQQYPNLPLNGKPYFDPNFDRFLDADSQGRFMVGTQLIDFGIPDYGIAQTDFMPDVFNFNFNGYSGSFVLKRDGTPFLLEKKGIKIETEINGPMNVNFTITTEDGTKYAFREKAVSQTAFENNTRYISSWHLSEITTINNNIIAFSYDNHIGKSLPLKTFIQHYQVASTNGNGINSFINSSGPQNQIDDIYLNSIQFPSGVVTFNYSAQGERSDISESHYLKNIEVTDKNTKLIKRNVFYYTYFGSAFNGTTLLDNGDYGEYVSNSAGVPDLNLRLRLDAVVENDTKTHSFEYYGSNLVPNKTSMAQDYWGFHNGEYNSQSFIPYKTDLNGSPYDIPKKAKRHPNVCSAKVFNLKKITYPTKGYTEFDYELNTYDGSNFEEPAPPSVQITSDPAFDTGDSGQNVESSVTIIPKPIGNPVINLIINLDIYNYQGDDYDPDDESGDTPQQKREASDFVFSTGMRVKVLRDADQSILYQGGFDSPLRTRNPDPAKANWSARKFFEVEGTVRQTVVIPNIPINPGETYTLIAYFDDHDYHSIYDGVGEYSGVVEIRAEWTEENVSETEAYSVGGGLRVKSIEDYDYNGDLARKRNFKYHYTDANGIEKSYGKIKTLPNYDTDQTSITSVIENRQNVQIIVANAVSQNTFSKDMGSYVGYDQVEIQEVDGLGKSNGKTISLFNNFADQIPYFNGDILHKDDFYEYPPIRLPHNGLLYEQQQHKWVDDDNDDPYILVQKIEKDYEINGISDTSFILEELYRNPDYTISAILETRNDGFGNKSQNPADLKFQFRPYYSNWVQQVSQKETLYDENGLDSITTDQQFYYENLQNYLLTKRETVDSKGNMITNETFYPDDISNVNSLEGGVLSPEAYGAIAKMKHIGENIRVGQPIQVETTVNGKKTVQRTNFRQWSTGLVLPHSIMTLKGLYDPDTNAMETRTAYDEYDEIGNPLQISKSDGPKVSYIWGYHGEYPIAKIENANFSDVSPYVDNLELKSNQDNDRTVDIANAGTIQYVGKEGELREALNNLRVNIPRAMVTTYTYDPLVGVTSMTDPRGYTIYYEYDDYNRLKTVKDAEGNLVTDYEYGYKQAISN